MIRRLTGALQHRLLSHVPRRGGGYLEGFRLTGAAAQYAHGDYEPDVVTALARLVEPGFVCADVGAHVGCLTLLLARLVGPDGRVIAFEASAENVRTLRENVALNGLDDAVAIEHAAVLDESLDEVDLYAGRTGSSSEWTVSQAFASREDPRPTAHRRTTVRGVTLDDYFAGGGRLDLVKMDIEGAEARALPGMRRLLTDERPIVVLEFHREVGWPGVEALRDAGYRFEETDGKRLPTPSRPEDVPYHLVARPQER